MAKIVPVVQLGRTVAVQIFSAWWVATILYNYEATLRCEPRYYYAYLFIWLVC